MLQALRNFIPLVLIDLGDGLLPDLVEQIDQAIPDRILFFLATKLGGAQQQELHTQLGTIGNMGQRTASGRFFEPRTRVFLKRLGEREVPLPCPGRSDDLLPIHIVITADQKDARQGVADLLIGKSRVAVLRKK